MKRTVSDWMAHARASSDTKEVASCLDAAIALATSCSDHREVLAGLSGIAGVEPRLIAEVAQRTLETAKLEYQVWGIREAARARADALDDRQGAALALQEGVALFEAPRTDIMGQAATMLGQLPLVPAYDWVLLGQGYVEILQDSSGLQP